jgi:hypothetical protein
MIYFLFGFLAVVLLGKALKVVIKFLPAIIIVSNVF